MNLNEEKARKLGWTQEEINNAKSGVAMMNLRNRNARNKQRAEAPTQEQREQAQQAINQLEEN